MTVFLASLSDRVNQFGMRTVITMNDAAGLPRDLINDYGRLSLADVRAHAATYVGLETRVAQNSFMLYLLLADSMTPEFKNKVLLHVADFTVTNQPVGACLLKTIISQTYLDTRATTAHIRDTLVESSQQMLLFTGNVSKFNDWIRTQVGKLTARGETCQDILTYLWKAYQVAPDAQFRQYVRDRKNEHEDGRVDITYEALMLLAEHKYQALIQSEEWAQPTSEQSEIVAMQTKITHLHNKLAPKKPNNPKVLANQTTTKTSNKGKGGKDKKGKVKGDKQFAPGSIPAWKLDAPKSGEARTKVKDGKTYFWCLNHGFAGMWVIHKPADCKAHKKEGNESPSLEQKAMQTIINFADDMEDSTEGEQE
jgi:hypothetical protein